MPLLRGNESELDLHAKCLMRESREESIKRFLKLIDACQECSRAFHTNGTIKSKFEQFGFELQTELRRLGGVYATPNSNIAPTQDREGLLRTTLERYQDALDHVVSAHARAMLNRQSSEITDTLNELLKQGAA